MMDYDDAPPMDCETCGVSDDIVRERDHLRCERDDLQKILGVLDGIREKRDKAVCERDELERSCVGWSEIADKLKKERNNLQDALGEAQTKLDKAVEALRKAQEMMSDRERFVMLGSMGMGQVETVLAEALPDDGEGGDSIKGDTTKENFGDKERNWLISECQKLRHERDEAVALLKRTRGSHAERRERVRFLKRLDAREGG